MPVYTNSEKTILFSHVPKAGGTRITSTARYLGFSVAHEIRGNISRSMSWSRCSPQHFHADLLRQVVNLDAVDMAISIVRHPVERMISEFQFQVRTGISDRTEPLDWFDHAISRYLSDPYAFDNHLRPQVEFLDIDGIHVWKLEEGGVGRAISALAANKIDRPTGARRKLLNILKRSSRAAKIIVNVSEARLKEEVRAALYARRSVIETVYAQDFEALGYE